MYTWLWPLSPLEASYQLSKEYLSNERHKISENKRTDCLIAIFPIQKNMILGNKTVSYPVTPHHVVSAHLREKQAFITSYVL